MPANTKPASSLLETIQVVKAKQVDAASDERSNPSPAPSLTPIATSHNSTSTALPTPEIRPTIANPRNTIRTGGADTPIQQAATHSDPQASAGATQAGAAQPGENSTDSALGNRELEAPGDGESMILPALPDSSFALPSRSTKMASSVQEDEPVSPGQTKNSQDVSKAAPPPSSDTPLIPTPDTVADAPDQAQDKGAAPSVRDSKQLESSGHKNNGEVVPELTKASDPNPGLSKTNADSLPSAQFGIQASAQTGRAAPQVVGAPQGRAESAATSLPTAYQSAVHGVVSSARLTQQAGSAEMQVRLRTEALGPIDVHTVVKGSDIGASIRVEGRDTQAMMANELSRLEQALNERSLRVQRLDVLQGSVSGSQSGGAGTGNDRGNPSPPRPGSASHSGNQTYPALPETPSVYEDGALEFSAARINLRV
jgi:hypothetical protein